MTNILASLGFFAVNRFRLVGAGALVLVLSAIATNGESAAVAVASAEPQNVVATQPVTVSAAAVVSAPVSLPAEKPAAEPVVIDYNEADMQSVLRTLAAKAGVNLILGDEVTGKVSVHLEGVGYEDAMRLVVESKGYAYVKDKQVVRIKSRESIDTEPVELRVYTLNYAKAEDVRKTLESVLSKQGKIQVDARSNTLVISDTPSSLAKLVPLIEALDTQTPQVMIEAKFVETTKNPKKDLGFDWSKTLLSHELSAGPFQLTKNLSGGPWIPSTALLDAGEARVVFSYLNADTDTELLANPRVVTTDNGKAKISIATQFPIPQFSFSEQTGSFQISGFEYKDIGIILTVLPRINKNEFVTLEVTPEASSSTENATLTSGGGNSVQIPIINTRVATTTVLIKSGNTLAIGGLMRQDVSDKYTKVPVFGDIPVLGAFFRSKSLDKTKRDLLIFLTPTIVGPDARTGYEQFYGGKPHEEVYTNDKWMRKDNAKPKPRNFIPWGEKSSSSPDSSSKAATQNFGSK